MDDTIINLIRTAIPDPISGNNRVVEFFQELDKAVADIKNNAPDSGDGVVINPEGDEVVDNINSALRLGRVEVVTL